MLLIELYIYSFLLRRLLFWDERSIRRGAIIGDSDTVGLGIMLGVAALFIFFGIVLLDEEEADILFSWLC